MEDLIVGFQAAPVWAQVTMVLFAITAVVMVFGPSVRNRRCRRHFDGIAHGMGTQAAGDEWPFTFAARSGERPFTVRYDYRTKPRGQIYRGPLGPILITATQLAGTRWGMHQVDLAPLRKSRFSWLARDRRSTGDADFDARFVVTEEGLPVRHGWLDADTRRAFARFFEAVPLPGVIWIREGELQFLMEQPWHHLDGASMRSLLERQAALAGDLDRTARISSTGY